MYQRGGIWISDFKIDGIRHKKSWGSVSKTFAKEKEAKYKTEIREGKHDLKSRNMLFEILSEKYLEYARLNKKPKSAKRNETSITMLWPHFQGKTLGSIDPFMLERYKKDRKEKGTTPGTINRDIDCIKNMMKKVVEWRFLSQNPFRDVKRLREKSERMWILAPEEEKKLLEACEKSPQRKKAKYLRDLVLFALNSGMREAEIFNVRKDQVDLRNNFILVTETKKQ